MERFAHNGLLHMGGGRLRAVAVPVLHRHVFGGNGLVNGRHVKSLCTLVKSVSQRTKRWPDTSGASGATALPPC